ncbi:CAAX geranylgeranyltransferase alpha subunit [Conoideocrella luteorostrata]|uniref:Protein farnesyltransferase/geranylgeranyltransferase type-1 subunit alpha n=1 Tax=Conoideocrella luteorostrata TaxID=1105319 RepID=A0AAJ0G2S2_9HYPO|nr:CAAX geranylgeranyltransferase alpha subunit [Conoideocrella luteorostrata]
MAAEECSPRCLRLTEHIISMNPAHYTVWLYRFKIVKTLELPVPEEIEWLNQVALSNLKNYQIWHHRQLLLDYYFPFIASDEETIKKLARTEIQFVNSMLDEDTKNYHVWSYRQYLVTKLGMWNIAELAATQNLIEDDIRNNSAWAHRFFLAFSDPAVHTPDLPATVHDPKVPASIIDREVDYAKEKIALAPQNQSSWNYLRGVLVKGGRSLSDVTKFAEEFATNLGEEGEDVKSSHALDLLADAYHQSGKTDKAKLCLQRLWEKWDPVRAGYWKHRALELGEAKA